MTIPNLNGFTSPGQSAVRRATSGNGQHAPVTVTGAHPVTKMPFRLDTWLFHFTESEASFNAERIAFYEGMRVTLISRSNFAVEAVVSSVKQYSLSSQEVCLEIDDPKNHRPSLTEIFGD